VAITVTYKTENQLGLTVEGEILDSQAAPQIRNSAVVDVSSQLAAVMRTELSHPYSGDYWDGPSAKELIDEWSARLRKAIDSSHGQ
jgi:hypothetical protein